MGINSEYSHEYNDPISLPNICANGNTCFLRFIQAGVTRLHWEDCLVYTACLDGMLRLWDARSGNCEREWHGHRAAILDMAVSR